LQQRFVHFANFSLGDKECFFSSPEGPADVHIPLDYGSPSAGRRLRLSWLMALQTALLAVKNNENT
jgi:hypothetical protein